MSLSALPFALLLICLWGLFSFPLQAQSSRPGFETEQLSFAVQDSLWLFDGDFGFYNSGNQELDQAIYFPVPSNETQSQAMGVNVVIGEQQQSLPVYGIGPQGFWFQLSMQPQSYETVRIRYQQVL